MEEAQGLQSATAGPSSDSAAANEGLAALALIVIVNVSASFAPIRPHCFLAKGLQDLICFILLWDVGSVVSPDCQSALWLQYTVCFWIKFREMEPAWCSPRNVKP